MEKQGDIRRILIVDDQADIRKELSKLIERLSSDYLSPVARLKAKLHNTELPAENKKSQISFQADSAPDGETALKMVRKAIAANEPYGVIFLDMRMPDGWDGLQTMLKLWEEEPRLQIVLCSAYSDYSWDEIFEKTGRRDNFLILKKPFDVEEVSQLAFTLSEKSLSEKHLSYVNNCLEEVFQTLPFMLAVVDKEGIIRLWNQAAVDLTSLSVGEAMAESVWRVVPFLEAGRGRLEPLFKEGKTVRRQRQNWRFNEEEKFLEISMYPLAFTQLGEGGALFQIEDITESVKKDEYLLQSQKMETVGNLTAGLAHDFNNVIGSIGATMDSVEFSLKKAEDLEKLRGFLTGDIEVIKSAVKRGTGMVEQLLSLSRHQDRIFTVLDLKELVEEALSLCRKSLDRNVEVEVFIEDNTASILGDEGRLVQVFINLFINASHAMTIMRPATESHGGQLIVAATKVRVGENILKVISDMQRGDYWVLSITDTGIGMDSATQARIFDPFFSTKDSSAGTGLGLSMVYYIVQQHDGFVQIDSKPGEGTTFFLFLPAY